MDVNNKVMCEHDTLKEKYSQLVDAVDMAVKSGVLGSNASDYLDKLSKIDIGVCNSEIEYYSLYAYMDSLLGYLEKGFQEYVKNMWRRNLIPFYYNSGFKENRKDANYECIKYYYNLLVKSWNTCKHHVSCILKKALGKDALVVLLMVESPVYGSGGELLDCMATYTIENYISEEDIIKTAELENKIKKAALADYTYIYGIRQSSVEGLNEEGCSPHHPMYMVRVNENLGVKEYKVNFKTNTFSITIGIVPKVEK